MNSFRVYEEKKSWDQESSDLIWILNLCVPYHEQLFILLNCRYFHKQKGIYVWSYWLSSCELMKNNFDRSINLHMKFCLIHLNITFGLLVISMFRVARDPVKNYSLFLGAFRYIFVIFLMLILSNKLNKLFYCEKLVNKSILIYKVNSTDPSFMRIFHT